MQPALVDTHAHIHFDAYAGQVDAILRAAAESGVQKIIAVGVNTADSLRALELAGAYEHVFATVGIHPHNADEAEQGLGYLRELAGRRKVVAIGECGLDRYKSTSTPAQQEVALRGQIEIALELGRPLVLHVRDAFEAFWPIIDDYTNIRGVVHCFSGGRTELEQVLQRNLYVALNGIMTFTKDEEEHAAARAVPGDRLLLETDCPFLSPASHRGKTNEPARVADIAAFIADLRGEPLAHLAATTTANAKALFAI